MGRGCRRKFGEWSTGGTPMRHHCMPASARLAAAISMALLAPIALAVETDWQVADGDWLLPGNWSAGLPGLVDTARIDNAGIVRIAADRKSTRLNSSH